MAGDLVQAGHCTKVVSIGGGLHHAKPSYGEGFCIYNDVAFCARYLIEKHGLERVLVLDTDAHAGNGTCEIFYDDPRVLFIDIHQNPRTVYPGTGYAHEIGRGKGEGFTVNIPMPVRAGNESFKLAFETIIEPITNEFKPQIIIRNGGSDPHFLDHLTNLGVTVEGFRMIGERVRRMAEVCDGKVIDLLTSGYNLDVLPHAWLALICGLADLKVPVKEPYPVQHRQVEEKAGIATENVIDEVRYRLSRHWTCLK
jgi:acetoin utilization protein AcuC